MSERTPGPNQVSELHPAVKAGGIAGALAAAAALIMMFEGSTNRAVIPVKGDVPTICYGHTQGVHMGDTASKAQCKAYLKTDLRTALRVQRCIYVTVPEDSLAAFISFAYNVGPSTFCGSSVARDLNAGHLDAACRDMGKFVYVKGRVVQGLVNRRKVEVAYCQRGL